MKARLLLSFLFIFSFGFSLGFTCALAADSQMAPGYPGGSAWQLLETRTAEADKGRRVNGWAYMISGGAALAISVPGFYLSDDLFARVIYSVGQTIGVTSIGYGAYLLYVEDHNKTFVDLVSGMPRATREQKEYLATQFLRKNAERSKSAVTVRAITHTITAILNTTSALTTSVSELKTALFFLAGINTIAAIDLVLSKSEEEKLYESIVPNVSIRARPPAAKVSLVVGAVNGLQVSF